VRHGWAFEDGEARGQSRYSEHAVTYYCVAYINPHQPPARQIKLRDATEINRGVNWLSNPKLTYQYRNSDEALDRAFAEQLADFSKPDKSRSDFPNAPHFSNRLPIFAPNCPWNMWPEGFGRSLISRVKKFPSASSATSSVRLKENLPPNPGCVWTAPLDRQSGQGRTFGSGKRFNKVDCAPNSYRGARVRLLAGVLTSFSPEDKSPRRIPMPALNWKLWLYFAGRMSCRFS